MLVYIFSALFIGWSGAWLVTRYGYIFGFIDKPNHRSSHSVETPKGGGIGILFAFLTAAVWTGSTWALWIPALLLALLSLYGDKLNLSQKLRLAVQLLCAGIFIHFAAENNYHEISSSTGLPAILIVLAFIFILIGTANYYNFMDGINGIAGITGVIAFGTLATIAYNTGILDISVICISISSACLGFLILNISGKVFMGDVGSILLGFLFAGIAILLSRNLLDIFCYFAFIFPFYADELISVMSRLKKRQSLFKPHRGHLYQLLANELKIPHWKIAFSYGFFQIIIILLIQKIRNYGLVWILAIEIVFFLIFLAVYNLILNAIRQKHK